jgi:hypothetical protein
MRKKVFGVVCALAFLCACATCIQDKPLKLDKAARIAVGPVFNRSDSPQAGSREQEMLFAQLRARGFAAQEVYRPQQSVEAADETAEAAIMSDALAWARKQGYSLLLCGSVQEWHYKPGLEGQPAVGLSINAVDVSSGLAVWTASGAKTGWGRDSLSGTAQALSGKLLGGLKFK